MTLLSAHVTTLCRNKDRLSLHSRLAMAKSTKSSLEVKPLVLAEVDVKNIVSTQSMLCSKYLKLTKLTLYFGSQLLQTQKQTKYSNVVRLLCSSREIIVKCGKMIILLSLSNTEMHFKNCGRVKLENLVSSKVLESQLEARAIRIENSLRVGQKMP